MLLSQRFREGEMLYIVATPIGNLGDITYRAVDTLMSVDFILCEDTRQAIKLLNHYGIKKKLVSYYKDNERRRLDGVIGLLLEGRDVALICDRGTPGVSDPAYLLVSRAREKNIEVTSVPGPSALTAALSICGLPSDSVSFYGFPPRKKGKKETFFQSIIDKSETVVFYESVHRIQKTLQIMNDVMPDRDICVCRELTKKFEEVKIGKVFDIYTYFRDRKVKGEFVVIIKGRGR